MRIFDLKKDGYQFTWKWEREDGTVVECQTDKEGCGLWEYLPRKAEWRQTKGTCDFMLRGMSLSGARKKIKRTFIED
ncbi:MAG: hypothetical protein IKN43_08475 [Selenomonadaceae bacterium]|nr:hypothetical protein [Selenomonadaceae bacterium]